MGVESVASVSILLLLILPIGPHLVAFEAGLIVHIHFKGARCLFHGELARTTKISIWIVAMSEG